MDLMVWILWVALGAMIQFVVAMILGLTNIEFTIDERSIFAAGIAEGRRLERESKGRHP